MGTVCSGDKSIELRLIDPRRKNAIPRAEQSTQNPSDHFSKIITNEFSPQGILDDDFETEIVQAITDCMASIDVTSHVEQHGIAHEIQCSISESFHHFIFSNTLDKNETKTNKKVYKKMTNKKVKQQLCDRINERIKPSFELQTADLEPTSREMARSFIQVFIKNLVDERMNH
ncbi:unnamed protein product [Rotaria magnacalcarata]|uniref:Uncharacterized protein n=1 Tax=Rotaria magnacalcarata TaxID=392030 RepID=A0A819D8K3_9BILA|nr:unnamed protein product [Rotaria magnacalcarata]CAF2090562.1 unnamed protein product [Rotaria magnacalcarata]CAF3824295.1 unnamed protein product [Rotaria magnacalcarata]CAF3928690.1 unnamed protein product [Rotaria magnacalcarata]